MTPNRVHDVQRRPRSLVRPRTRPRFRVDSTRARATVERVLGSREAVIYVGLATLLVVWWIWGALNPVAVTAEERSYLLQARIFASGRWTAPTPPRPAFFQQPDVLMAPALASRFPPGHALFLALGALVGAPMLVPLLLSGITGSLLFMLARRLTNGWTALLAWIIWLGDPINLRFRPTYLSEITTSALWLGGWWALLEWRATGKRRWMLAVAAACGYGAITRPLTALVFAIPVAAVLTHDVVRRRAWRDLMAGVAVGIALFGVIPLWSLETTGDWRETPLAVYRRDYLPVDQLGFSVDVTPPARRLSPPVLGVYKSALAVAKEHARRNVVVTTATRAGELARQEWGGIRVVIGGLSIVGLFAAGAVEWFAFSVFLLLFAAYLAYPAPAAWTAHYLEALPVLAFLSAGGVQLLVRRARFPAAWPLPKFLLARGSLAAASILTVLATTSLALSAGRSHVMHVADARDAAAFQRMLDGFRGHRVVIFVRYANRLSSHAPVGGGARDLEEEPIWVVHDLGHARDEKLMDLTPYRVPLVFSEATGQLKMLRTASSKK
jgi:dolichyl-phosphate-mannose-protein mannosyltransferase